MYFDLVDINIYGKVWSILENLKTKLKQYLWESLVDIGELEDEAKPNRWVDEVLIRIETEN